MSTFGSKRGETAQRIYDVLERNPDLTAAEIAAYMPNLTRAAVACAINKMKDKGVIAVRGQKAIKNVKRGRKTAFAYYLKEKPKKVRRVAPVVKPKVVGTPQPTWSVADIKPEPEGPKTPKAEREVLVLRHLTDIYKSMTLMTDQQDALIAILKDTLAQLDATEQELDRERQRRNWWDKVKGLFQ